LCISPIVTSLQLPPHPVELDNFPTANHLSAVNAEVLAYLAQVGCD